MQENILNQTVTISSLPLSIQNQLPMTIRTYKDEYVLSELPPQIQFLLIDYLKNTKNIKYKTVYDITPDISEYGDFDTLPTIKTTVLEYLKNYFLTLPNDYPFDPVFGSTLKLHLQTKDTQLRKTLVSAEVDSIINVLTADLGVNVKINSINIENLNKGDRVEYVISIDLSINEENVNITFSR